LPFQRCGSGIFTVLTTRAELPAVMVTSSPEAAATGAPDASATRVRTATRRVVALLLRTRVVTSTVAASSVSAFWRR
jgi:hypothetical protein